MTYIGARLRYLRKQDNITQQQLADEIGIAKSTVSMYETGRREPDFEALEKLADFFNVPMSTFFPGGETPAWPTQLPSNITPMPSTVSRPRLGAIACGEPILAEQNIECYDSVPEWVDCDFTLVCRGDSMINARIFDGDIVCIRQQPEVESGEIAAVMVGEDEATLKRVRILENGVALLPENNAYEPMFFMGEDAAKVRILGKATHFIGAIK